MVPSTLLLVSHGNDLEYLNIMLNILENSGGTFTNIEIVDLSGLLEDQDTFSRKILRFANLESPESLIFSELERLGFVVHDLANSNMEIDGSTLISTTVKEALDESVRSAMVSRTNQDNPIQTKWVLRKKRRYEFEALTIYLRFIQLLNGRSDVRRVAVINGRFPCQRAIKEASLAFGIPCFTYERGSYEGEVSQFDSAYSRYEKAINYWYSPYPAYDRLARQKAILGMSFSEELLKSDLIINWFSNRQISGNLNKFANEWSENPYKFEAGMYATIFTSSVDEFAELGQSWREDSWGSQWEAFDNVIKELLKNNWKVILRVHPNLSNKPKASKKSTLQEVQNLRLKYPEMFVIDAESKLNSYEILRGSTLAIVWISTIGLEASAMGIKTVVLAASEYDLVADVKRWLNPDDINLESLNNWVVDFRKSYAFRAGVLAHDHTAKFLLEKYAVPTKKYGSGIALFANKWAMRNSNKLTNLISIFLPRRIFLKVRPIYRKIKMLTSFKWEKIFN